MATARAEVFGREDDEDWSDLDEDVVDELAELMAEYAPVPEEDTETVRIVVEGVPVTED